MSAIECPSGLTFTPRKLGGRLFAQLAAKSDSVGSLGDIVEQCSASIEDAGPYALGKDGKINWKRVLAGDLAVAFVGIRTISLPATYEGTLFKWTLKCPNLDCRDEHGKRTEYIWTVDVGDVPRVKLTDETRDLVKRGNVFPGKLLDGRAFTYKLPTDEDAPVIRKLLTESGISRTELAKLTDENVGQVIRPFLAAARVLSVAGCTSVSAARSEVLDSDILTIADVERQINERDGGFDSFEAECPECATKQGLALPSTPQLLFSLSHAVLKGESLPTKTKGPSPSAELGASSTPASPG